MTWTLVGCGYLGLVLYILVSLVNPADESFSAISDVFLNRGRTVLTAAIVVVPVMWLLAETGQLNKASALFAGYFNVSAFRKAADGWMERNK